MKSLSGMGADKEFQNVNKGGLPTYAGRQGSTLSTMIMVMQKLKVRRTQAQFSRENIAKY
jgi:hypothetical protein